MSSENDQADQAVEAMGAHQVIGEDAAGVLRQTPASGGPMTRSSAPPA